MEPTEASQKNSSKSQTNVTNEVKDDLFEFDHQPSYLKTTTDANVEDGLDDLDPSNQDDADPLDGATGFKSDALIDLISLDVSLSYEFKFYFDNMETIMF